MREWGGRKKRNKVNRVHKVTYEALLMPLMFKVWPTSRIKY